MRQVMCYLLLILFLVACSNDNNNDTDSTTPQAEEVGMEVLMQRNDVVWGFDFLPNRNIIFSERSGNIAILNPADGSVTDVTGEPPVVQDGESGLLDLKLHPNFASNNFVYFCFTDTGKFMALARATLEGTRLSNVQKIFRSIDTSTASNHFGCRIAFDNDSHVFLSLGEQNVPAQSQNLGSFLGKILRLNDDGTVPTDNPFIANQNALPQIWSLGHRNPQGLTFRPGTNQLFSSEHGPTGGDELNIIQKGANYGWPLVTRGTPPGPLGQSAPGFVDPIASYTPAIAPSGIAFWRGQLYVACLRGEQIRRITLDGDTVTNQAILFGNEGLRFRNVRVGPDDLLYFSTDDGKIGRLNSP